MAADVELPSATEIPASPFESAAAPNAAPALPFNAAAKLDIAPKIDFSTPQLQVIPPAGMKGEPPEEERPRTQIVRRAPEKPESVWLIFFNRFFPIVSLIFLAVLAAIFVMARSEITQKAPGMLAIYNAVSISPLPPGGGLSIVNVRDQSRFGQLDNALVLSGEIINHTPTNLRVPLFKMIFTSPTGQSKTFMARGPVDKIDGAAVVPFILERAGFAQEGWSVKLTFGDGSEGNDTSKASQTEAPAKK